MTNKKVGIVADNYKLPMFERELQAAGFDDYTIGKFEPTPDTKNVSIIHVNVREDLVPKVHNICKKVEFHFKRGN